MVPVAVGSPDGAGTTGAPRVRLPGLYQVRRGTRKSQSQQLLLCTAASCSAGGPFSKLGKCLVLLTTGRYATCSLWVTLAY